MRAPPVHDVRVVVDGQRLSRLISYDVDVDRMQPADSWRVELPRTAADLRSAALDAPMRVEIDGIPVISGYVGEVSLSRETITVSGRSRCGRLVDESIPGAGYNVGATLMTEAVRNLAAPWFERVIVSNAADRRLRLGRGVKAATGREPGLTFAQFRAVPRHIDGGTTRWQAIESIIRPLRLIAWSTADGTALVVASPNYTQEPQYDFYETIAASNVLAVTWSDSLEQRYAVVEVSGSGRPLYVPAPPFIPQYPGHQRPKPINRSRIGVVRDGPNDDGTGAAFRFPKRLFVVSEALSMQEAQAEAARTYAQQLATARTLSVTAPGHGQVRPGARQPTIFAPDTIARVRIEAEASVTDRRAETLMAESMYVVRCSYRGDRRQEQTELSMVPRGTLLA
jgi:prophage tail gpP-like protein